MANNEGGQSFVAGQSGWYVLSTPVNVGPSLLDRVYGNDGALIVKADISSIAYSAVRNGTEEATGAIAVATSVFDALQDSGDDERWADDGTGFNFAWKVPNSVIASAGTYDVVITFTPVSSGDPFKLRWQVCVDGDLS